MATPSGGKQEGEQDKLQVFTIAFDTKSKAATFAGNMPIEQAAGLIQQILQERQREQIRKEVEAEISKKEEG